MPTVRYIVRGKVQGVGFRYHVTRVADAFDITGTVRNVDDGSVEIVASGTPENLRSFKEQVEIGPAGARVDRILVEELPDARHERFIVLR